MLVARNRSEFSTSHPDCASDLGFFDDETCRLEPAENPLQAKVFALSQVRTVTDVSGPYIL